MPALEKKMLKKMRNAMYDFWMIKAWETIIIW